MAISSGRLYVVLIAFDSFFLRRFWCFPVGSKAFLQGSPHATGVTGTKRHLFPGVLSTVFANSRPFHSVRRVSLAAGFVFVFICPLSGNLFVLFPDFFCDCLLFLQQVIYSAVAAVFQFCVGPERRIGRESRWRVDCYPSVIRLFKVWSCQFGVWPCVFTHAGLLLADSSVEFDIVS